MVRLVFDPRQGAGFRLIGRLHLTQQRMLVLPGISVDLIDLGFCNVAAIGSANPFAAGMDVQHDLSCSTAVHAKKCFQYLNHKLHGRVVVIE